MKCFLQTIRLNSLLSLICKKEIGAKVFVESVLFFSLLELTLEPVKGDQVQNDFVPAYVRMDLMRTYSTYDYIKSLKY